MYSDLIGYVQNGGYPLFAENTYVSEQNHQEYKEYLLTRDGFSLLVMGFTGTKALEWKLKYIEAFNQMEQYLKSNSSVAYLNGVSNLLNTIRRVMKDQNSSAHKIAQQMQLLCNNYNVPLLNSFVEPAYEQVAMKTIITETPLN